MGQGRPYWPAAPKPGFRSAEARCWGLPPRPAGRGWRGCGRRRAALRCTLTHPAGSRVPAPASSLPPAPTAPQAAPLARTEPAKAPRRLGALSGRLPPCPCPRLPSGDACPAPRHGALLYPSRSRWPCRAPACGLSPCARLSRCAREPSGRGSAGVARPRNSMQLRPPPQLLPGGPPGAWRPPAVPAPLCPRAQEEPGFSSPRQPAPSFSQGPGAPTPTPSPCQ